ncbi:MAG: cobalamin biosynthesis protein CobD [Clostridia bacterium]|nr:cobalamin biosynthesis protein CobD [Clostridia bacterium]
MIWSLAALVIGFIIDLIVGDPHTIPHPVMLIGKLVSLLETAFRRIFPKSEAGERAAGVCLWFVVAILSAGVPIVILSLCMAVNPWLRLAVESVMCWQIIAVKSLRVESMKVYRALSDGEIFRARRALSMIVGRDTENLDESGIVRATVETVAENTSDGAVAPMLFLAVGGAPAGFLYKAINTMDSMIGYIDPPYTNIGMFAARADDAANLIPSRLSALFMLAAGAILRLDVKNGVKIFKRDRYNHKSPNSAQTESVCAGLLGVRLAGDAYYRGVLHEKPYIGDELREIRRTDIAAACRILYAASIIALLVFCAVKLIFVL